MSIPDTVISLLFFSAWRLHSCFPAQFWRRHPSLAELATSFHPLALNGAAAGQPENLAEGRVAMSTLATQTKKVLGFFNKIAQRLYDARLARADRDVNHHRAFLGKTR